MRRFLFLVVMILCVVSVSAAGCCSLNLAGEKCAVVEEEDCRDDGIFAIGAACLSTSFCQKGCCYDESAGIYDKSVLRVDCSEQWNSDPGCNMAGAIEGCCILGEVANWETLVQCEGDNLFYGVGVVDWRTDVGQVECSFIGSEVKMGACVGAGTCKMLSEEACYNVGGVFNEGYLCTSDAVDGDCEMTKETICVDGKDGVYFLDSCGNVANVYDAVRVSDVDYWDRIVEPVDLCGVGSMNGNANSEDCGNCDRFKGGYCSSAFSDNFDVDYGSYYCKDTACLFKGDRYENGESWCVYDGVTGNGKDVVGSRHWRYVCSQGTVQIEPCADYRNEVCTQSNTLGNGSDEIVFRHSVCQKNDWIGCLNYNEESDWKELCKDDNQCFVNSYSSSGTSKSVCMANVSGGFDFADEDENNEGICALGNSNCIVKYKKSLPSGDWKVVSGKECLTESFTQAANDLCASLGDCGAYVNINEEVTTRGYKNSKAQLSQVYLNRLKIFARAVDIDGDESDTLNKQLLISLESNVNNDAFRAGMFAYAAYLMLFPNPGSYIVAAIAIIAGTNPDDVLDDILGIDMKKKKVVYFTCEPWTQPRGGDDCEVCNDDPLKPCSKYRCESLGGACELVNIGSATEYCVDLSPRDSKAPEISSLESVALNSRYVGESSGGFRIEGNSGECLDAYLPLSFGIETDVLAECRFDIEAMEFENMSRDFDGARYLYEHSMTFVLPDPTHGESLGSNWTGDLSFYVKCRDVHGHENVNFYEVEMCVNAGPDKTAALIKAVEPMNGGAVSFDVSSKNISVVTNELADCRWSVSDVDYSLMANSMDCDDELNYPSSSIGYECRGVVPIVAGDNVYYVRCMDQPWLGNSSDRNANSESFVYSLMRPESKIVIDSIEPSEDFEVDSVVSDIELRVGTFAGGNVHTCFYSFSGYDRLIEMFETGGTSHVQPLSLPAERHRIFVECIDEAGDSVRGESEFRIVYDTSTPQVARVWQDGGKLHFVTTEVADCKYSTNSCKFDWDSGESAGNGMEHIFSIVRGDTYYIKCEDEFGNVPVGCSITVRAL